MSDREDPQTPTDDAIASLLATVGPRQNPSELELARLKRLAVERWQRKTARLRRRRRALYAGVALAASALVATLAAVGWGLLGGSVVVGAVEQAAGGALLNVGDGSTTPLAAGLELPAGADIETGPDGRLAIRLGDALSLRLSGGSRATLLDRHRVALARGAVYVDSGGEPEDSRRAGEPALEIRTPLGTVTDIGTRFEVRAGDGSLRVRVRDGRIALARGGERHEAEAGWQLLVSGDGEPERSPVAVHGDEWAWVLEAAPPFDIEGRTLGEFLAWVGGETGWRIVMPVEQEAGLRAIVLHGSVAGLTAAEAPDLVLPGCGVEYGIADGALSLRRGEG